MTNFNLILETTDKQFQRHLRRSWPVLRKLRSALGEDFGRLIENLMQIGPPQAISREKGTQQTLPSSLAARVTPWAHPPPPTAILDHYYSRSNFFFKKTNMYPQ